MRPRGAPIATQAYRRSLFTSIAKESYYRSKKRPTRPPICTPGTDLGMYRSFQLQEIEKRAWGRNR
jgi:hypothetical protein